MYELDHFMYIYISCFYTLWVNAVYGRARTRFISHNRASIHMNLIETIRSNKSIYTLFHAGWKWFLFSPNPIGPFWMGRTRMATHRHDLFNNIYDQLSLQWHAAKVSLTHEMRLLCSVSRWNMSFGHTRDHTIYRRKDLMLWVQVFFSLFSTFFSFLNRKISVRLVHLVVHFPFFYLFILFR